MSELKVNSIKGVAASTAAITVHNTDGSCTAKITNNLSHRNLLHNGQMIVNQRGTVVNAGNEYGGPDRWKFMKNDGAFTVSKDTDVPAGEGFGSSYKIDCTSVAGTSGVYYVHLLQYIEGQDLQRVKKGTSNAEQLTISFWIKSTKTGIYVVELYDQDNTRHTSKSYTVSTTNDWEKKTITFAADTTGAFGNDNQASLRVILWFYAGSSFQGGTLAGTWAANVSANRAEGQVNAFDSTSNNVFVTGVQLEVSDYATEFEHLSYGDELLRCQRYLYRITGENNHITGISGATLGTTEFTYNIIFPVNMRTTPTYTGSATAVRFAGGDDGDDRNFNQLSIHGVGSKQGMTLLQGSSGGGTNGYAGNLQFRANNGYMNFSAEL